MAATMVVATAAPAFAAPYDDFKAACAAQNGTFDGSDKARSKHSCTTNDTTVTFKEYEGDPTRLAGSSGNAWTPQMTDTIEQTDTTTETFNDYQNPQKEGETVEGEPVVVSTEQTGCKDPGGNLVEDPNHKHCQPDGGPGKKK